MSSRLFTIAPVPSTTFESTSFRTPSVSSRVSLASLSLSLSALVTRPSYMPRSSSSSSPLSSLVLFTSLLSRAEFIPPAKYSRVRLPISAPSSLALASPRPPITVLSASEHAFFLPFIIYSDYLGVFRSSRVPSDSTLLSIPRLIFSLLPRLPFRHVVFYIPIYVLDKLLHELTAISNHFLRL